jgi:hypothetical protein
VKELKDERGGKPSASKGEDYEACHGKHQMESGLKDTSSAAAEEGNRIHLWLEDDQAIELSRDELALAKEMESQRCDVMDFVFPEWRDNPPSIIIKEERLWYRGNRYSGKADFVAINGKKALIVDYKCGRVPVSHARVNGQMRWNVALLDCEYDLEYVTVALIQPRCSTPTVFTYDLKGIKKARRRVTATLRKMEAENPSLSAGEKQCKYCKAKGFCPELNKKQEAISRVSDAAELSTSQLSELLVAIPAIEAKCKAIKSHAKDLLRENPNAIEGWELSSPAPTRTISSAESAFKELEDESMISAERFLASCSVSVTKLQREIVEHTGMGPTEAKRRMSEVLSGAMAEKHQEPRIRRAS